MRILQKDAARQQMNQYATDGVDFFFFVSYDTRQSVVVDLDEIDPAELLFAFPGVNNLSGDEARTAAKVSWHSFPPTFQQYETAFRRVQSHLRRGDSYLANLTCKVPVQTNLSLRDIFCLSHARYRCWWKDHFVCFSPEIFVQIADGVIRSFPMKGTIDATLPNAEQQLMADPKEAAEHATIVDLLRNDLSIVADRVSVERYRYVERLETHKGSLLQTSSEITGRLLPAYRDHVGDVLFTMLPAGSITGAPKSKTVEIITEAECYERGFYTGVMGCWAKGRLDSAVMIRFIDQEIGQFYYKAGGGITAKSDCVSEYNEVIEKVYVPIY
ncbi:MAG: aminodeoxychorismate synthase component I [Prevotella sp.]|nr:aminodeoxychorismate synthase component I [Prevotella sp.]